MSEFRTVDEAMIAGRDWLAVSCRPCRMLKHIPWTLLPGLLGGDRIADLHMRLVCKKCGTRPAPEDVSVAEPVTTPGFSYGPRRGG